MNGALFKEKKRKKNTKQGVKRKIHGSPLSQNQELDLKVPFAEIRGEEIFSGEIFCRIVLNSHFDLYLI